MRAVLMIAFAAMVATAVMGAARASASSLRSTTACPAVTGAKWKVNGKAGTKYTLGVRGVLCGYAIPYIPRLTGLHKPNEILKGGPTGWRCQATQSAGAWYGATCFASGGKAFIAIPSPA
jgi:hypothetical protein